MANYEWVTRRLPEKNLSTPRLARYPRFLGCPIPEPEPHPRHLQPSAQFDTALVEIPDELQRTDIHRDVTNYTLIQQNSPGDVSAAHRRPESDQSMDSRAESPSRVRHQHRAGATRDDGRYRAPAGAQLGRRRATPCCSGMVTLPTTDRWP